MEHYNEESSSWMKFRAMGFLVNFLKNHKKDVDSSDTFSLISGICTRAEFFWKFRKEFSVKERRLIKRLYRKSNGEEITFGGSRTFFLRTLWQVTDMREKMAAFVEKLVTEYLEARSEAEKSPDKKWMELVKMLQLDPFEEEVLLVTRCVAHNILEEYTECGRSNAEDAIEYIAKCLNCSKNKVSSAVSENSKLRRYDCVDSDVDFCYRLEDFLSGLKDDLLSSRFFNKLKSAPLPWDFYGELGNTHGPMLKQLLNSGRPVNVLFYGTPGTGKSSFARSLGAELKLECYNIAQSFSDCNRSSSDSSTNFRFAALQLCDKGLGNSRGLLIVDEADEMLQGSSFGVFFGGSATNEKGRLNAVLDTLKHPVIWITNTPPGALDESSRRRFDYSICFEPLNTAQRVAIWENNIRKMKLKRYFTPEMLSRLAARFPVSAGGITQALKNLAILAPPKAEAEAALNKLLEIHCELMGIDSKADDKLMPAKDYSLEGLNIKGELKLETIVGAVRKFYSESAANSPDRPRMNLLLSGPPGTGKTEFVKYLGEKLDRKIHVCMGSDLLNMYVGGTEQNIKNAFARAEAENAILFLDEIDGMVQSRERSIRSWEVTQVNELLHQMENFNGVMVGATNFLKNLDPAIMRRFTFKLEFNFLSDEGKKIFFERMFKTTLTPAETARLNAIENLAPGDFRTVRQALYYIEGDSNAMRLESLERESAAKPGCLRNAAKAKFGF